MTRFASEEERRAFQRWRQRNWEPPETSNGPHDPLCDEHTAGGAYYCICDVLLRARNQGWAWPVTANGYKPKGMS